jgi:hypothetical protein
MPCSTLSSHLRHLRDSVLEGLLGGLVYVNTFAEIDNVPKEDREFSLGATSVSDSGGICVAGFIGMALEVSYANGKPGTEGIIARSCSLPRYDVCLKNLTLET